MPGSPDLGAESRAAQWVIASPGDSVSPVEGFVMKNASWPGAGVEPHKHRLTSLKWTESSFSPVTDYLIGKYSSLCPGRATCWWRSLSLTGRAMQIQMSEVLCVYAFVYMRILPIPFAFKMEAGWCVLGTRRCRPSPGRDALGSKATNLPLVGKLLNPGLAPAARAALEAGVRSWPGALAACSRADSERPRHPLPL